MTTALTSYTTSKDVTETSPSNMAFDNELRSRNPEWGLRNVEDVTRCAVLHGFGQPEIHEMPANNLSVIFRRR